MSGSEVPTPGVVSAPRVVGFWWWLCIGAAAAALGLMPWLMTGARLPLQNLWATAVADGSVSGGSVPDGSASDGSASMPIALLPLSQYSITLIFGLVVTGSAVAGAVIRWTRVHQARRATSAVLCGTLLVQLIAGVQSMIVTGRGLEPGRWATIYLVALGVVVVLSLVIGIVVLLLIARGPVPGATVALSVAAFAVSSWLGGLLAPVGSVPGDAALWALGGVRWVPSIIIGAAIAWCGFRTIGRAVAVILSLLVLWVAPALITGVSSAVGSRVLAGYPDQMVEYGAQVFVSALTIPELAVPPVLAAVAVAAVGRVLWVVIDRRSPVERSA